MSPRLKEKIRHEAKNFFFVFLYVWAILLLLALHRAYLLKLGLFSGQLLAIINALVLGKVVVVLEFFQVGRKFRRHAPIYRALIKAVIFGLFLFVFRFVEEEIRGWFHGKTFSGTLAEIDNGRLMEMATLAILIIVALVPYFLLRDIAEAVGEQRLVAMLFHAPSQTPEGRTSSRP